MTTQTDVKNLAARLVNTTSAVQRFNANNRLVPGSRLVTWLSGRRRLEHFLALLDEQFLGEEFAESLAEYLDFSYSMSDRHIRRIPSEGRLLVMANRPLGGLDALALLLAVSKVRSDIHLVCQDPLTDVICNYYRSNPHLFNSRFSCSRGIEQKSEQQQLVNALLAEKVCIVFPAKRPDLWSWRSLQPARWQKKLFRLQKKTRSPVLPVFISGKNRLFFYLLRAVKPSMAAVYQLRQSLYPAVKTVELAAGHPIDGSAMASLKLKVRIKLMQKHIRAIAQNRAGFFKTFRNVVHPVERSLLRSEIADCERLGKTSDGMQILLTDFYSSPALMKEIARLRELTFRKVGEGTGHKTDIDRFDRSYRHLFLWDDRRLEIVGAYRLGLGDELVKQGGVEAFYSAGLFQIQKEFSSQLPTAIECGRSFVQPAYWNSMALDYLWHGIGAFLARHPEYKTLFGPVSISGLFVPEARDMLIYYYKKWYGARKMYAVSNNPVRLSDTTLRRCEEIFCGETAQKDFRILKSALKPYNLAVPALYKQYSELCEPGGVQFADFGVDTDFGGCTDGFIIVDVDAVTDKKRQRYIDSKKEPVSGGVQA